MAPNLVELWKAAIKAVFIKTFHDRYIELKITSNIY